MLTSEIMILTKQRLEEKEYGWTIPISYEMCGLTLEENIKQNIPKQTFYWVVKGEIFKKFNNQWHSCLEFDSKDTVSHNTSTPTNIKLYINVDKAKKTAKQIIRIKRTPLLLKLDSDYMKALESNNVELKNSIVDKKQILRDATSKIDSMSSIEEIELFLKSILSEDKNGSIN